MLSYGRVSGSYLGAKFLWNGVTYKRRVARNATKDNVEGKNKTPRAPEFLKDNRDPLLSATWSQELTSVSYAQSPVVPSGPGWATLIF